MQKNLSLTTSDGEAITAWYNPGGQVRLGDYWVLSETVYSLYNSLLNGERKIYFSTSGGPFMGESKRLTAILNPENQALSIGDYTLPVTEFVRFVVYAFKGDLREVPTHSHGDRVTMIPKPMQECLESILLNGLAPQKE